MLPSTLWLACSNLIYKYIVKHNETTPHFLQKIDDWRSMAMALGLAWLVSPFSWLQWAGQEQQEEEGGGGWPRGRLG